MPELIFSIILFCSSVAIVVIVFRKIPLLLKLPETAPSVAFKDIFQRAKKISPLRDFSFEMLLQKILSKFRVLIMKTDSKTWNWLQKLRKRAQKNKFEEDDNYWQEVKKSTKK